MKLATLKDDSRDGRLHIVSRDLSLAAPSLAAPTLQAALDDWANIAPLLNIEAVELDADRRNDTIVFDPVACAAPLPRAYQ